GQQIVQALLHMNRNTVMEYPDGTYDLISGQWNAAAMVSEGETVRTSNDIVAQGGFDYSFNDALHLRGDVTYKSDYQGTSTFMNRDRKSTRLNSSHVKISYAVFCLKKKT